MDADTVVEPWEGFCASHMNTEPRQVLLEILFDELVYKHQSHNEHVANMSNDLNPINENLQNTNISF